MSNKVLVAYASKAGATQEIACVIAAVLHRASVEVEVRNVAEVEDLSQYRAVILGTAIRIGKPIAEALKFVEQHRAALRQMPVACFSAGITMREDIPQNREVALRALSPLLAQVGEPIAVGLFAGKIDYHALSLPWRLLVSQDKSGVMREGDWRSWPAIREWSEELIAALAPVVEG